ncbi:MAG: hypothetical protein ACK6AD_06865 [Cyanobacteriota bacterium]
MPVAPSSSSPSAVVGADQAPSSPRPTEAGTPELAWLEGDLRQRLHRAADATGRSVAAVCEQWLREGLERFEAQQLAADVDSSGRCSLRTGARSLGPVPLPVQQSTP